MRNLNLPFDWEVRDGSIVWASHHNLDYQDCRALIDFLRNENLSNMKIVLNREEDLIQFLRASGTIDPLWENKKRIVEEAVKRYIQRKGERSLGKLNSVKFLQEDLHLTFEGKLSEIDQDVFKRELKQQVAGMFDDMLAGLQMLSEW